MKCEPNTMAGVTHHYQNRTLELDKPLNNLQDTCNSGCNCTTRSRDPVCDDMNVEYFSACFAGCKSSQLLENNTVLYSDCACSESPNKQAVSGKCESDCTLLPAFLVVLFVAIFSIMVCVPAGVVTSIRCVPDHQGAYALSVQWLFVRFLATIPGPILYGSIVDRTCIVWQDRCAEDDGSCWQYNQYNLGVNFMSLTLAVSAVICVIYFIAQFIYKAPPKPSKKEKEKDGHLAENGVGTEQNDEGLENPAFDETASVDTTMTKL